jgi:hypothetical protein
MESPEAKERPLQLTRYQPAEDLAFFVEYYWIVTWDFRGQGSYLAEILPHPSSYCARSIGYLWRGERKVLLSL